MMGLNAIILAAGTASRFVPLSQECPKGLLEVRGEILIERQIRQLHEAGISDITIVTGYMSDRFEYLANKFGVNIVLNEDFDKFNNTSSMIRVLDKLDNTYVLTSDNYYVRNPFLDSPTESFYSAIFANGETSEYCLKTDTSGRITNVSIGGKDSWYMYGPVFFNSDFSQKFKRILPFEYMNPEVRQGYWEDVFIKHIDSLLMNIKKCSETDILEFDSIDELRLFDSSYLDNTRSSVIKKIASDLQTTEGHLSEFKNLNKNKSLVFSFLFDKEKYIYNNGIIEKV